MFDKLKKPTDIAVVLQTRAGAKKASILATNVCNSLRHNFVS